MLNIFRTHVPIPFFPERKEHENQKINVSVRNFNSWIIESWELYNI